MSKQISFVNPPFYLLALLIPHSIYSMMLICMFPIRSAHCHFQEISFQCLASFWRDHWRMQVQPAHLCCSRCWQGVPQLRNLQMVVFKRWWGAICYHLGPMGCEKCGYALTGLKKMLRMGARHLCASVPLFFRKIHSKMVKNNGAPWSAIAAPCCEMLRIVGVLKDTPFFSKVIHAYSQDFVFQDHPKGWCFTKS